MIQSVSLTNSANNVRKSPTFGSVLLSRVVLQNVTRNGDIFYSILPQTETGMRGIYQSLALQVGGLKNNKIFQKLVAAIPDLNVANPKLGSTQANLFTGLKRFLLTADDVVERNDIGEWVYRQDLSPYAYSSRVRGITSDMAKRVKNSAGQELGVDIIVDKLSNGKYKIADVEVLPVTQLGQQKQPVKAFEQGTFDF